MQDGAPAPFEVHCERCRVTFPVGTRRCVHCGSPTSRAPRQYGLRVDPARESESEAESPETPDPELGRRRFVSPLTLVWVALIAAGYLVRACSGQQP